MTRCIKALVESVRVAKELAIRIIYTDCGRNVWKEVRGPHVLVLHIRQGPFDTQNYHSHTKS